MNWQIKKRERERFRLNKQIYRENSVKVKSNGNSIN